MPTTAGAMPRPKLTSASFAASFSNSPTGIGSKAKRASSFPEGKRFVAMGTAAAQVKWTGGKPAEYRMRQPGKPLPERETLGDLDKSQWELGPDGVTPRDPWQSTRFVYLVDPETAEAFSSAPRPGAAAAPSPILAIKSSACSLRTPE